MIATETAVPRNDVAGYVSQAGAVREYGASGVWFAALDASERSHGPVIPGASATNSPHKPVW